MTDLERAFLEDIAAHPQDDVPRLIYADFLEEHDQHDRAEFIRVQCELSRRWPQAAPTSEVTYSSFPPGLRHEFPQFDKLRRREQQLFSADDAQTLRWFDLPQPWARIVRLEPFDKDDPDYPYAVTRRGFIFRVTLPCAVFLEHAADIIAAVPMLEEVRLSDVEPEYSAMRNGWVYYDPRIEPLTELGEIPHFARCEERKDAEEVLSNYCLMFAREQLAARRSLISAH